jgi:hypothetical protein
LPEQLLCSAGGLLGERPVGAAFEAARRLSGLLEHRGGGRDVLRLARMRGAGERDFGIGEPVSVGEPALDERQGLQRLHGRARVDPALDVADGEDRRPFGVDDGDRAAMTRLDFRAARDLDQNRIVHDPACQLGGFVRRPVRPVKGETRARSGFRAASSQDAPAGAADAADRLRGRVQQSRASA